MSFNYVKLDLPSLCVPYPELKGKLSIRTFTGADEEIITTAPEEKTLDAVLEVLQSTVQGLDDISNLTGGDLMYIILWQAINSYQPEYRVCITCRDCQTYYEPMIDLNDINVVTLEKGLYEDVKLTLPISEKIISVRPPRLSDEYAPIMAVLGKEVNSNEYDLINRLTNWEEVEPQSKVLKEFESRNLPVKDIRYIEKAIGEFEHGPDMKFTHVCPNEECKLTEVSTLPFRLGASIAISRKSE